MDSVTHAAMGAVFAVALTPRLIGAGAAVLLTRRRLAVVGAVGGLLPDADAFIQSSSDALLLLEYHRHFTHSLAFVPIGALLAVALLWPFLGRSLGFRAMLVASLVGYLAHLLLDACTSYGTHLWLPFSSAQAALQLIAVIDPSFTALLLVPLFLALRRPESNAARWALPLALAYLGLATLQQFRVEIAAREMMLTRGHSTAPVSVKPSMANILLWRSVYAHDGRVYADAIRAGWTTKNYPGISAPLIDAAEAKRIAAGDASRLRDIERFRVFSKDYLVRDPVYPNTIGDARYAMVPNGIAPLWSIRWNAPGAPTEFINEHDRSPATRQQFIDMLLGR